MKTIKIVALSSIVLIAAGAATPAIAKTDIDNPNLTPISQDNSVPKITNGYIATVKIDGVSHSKIVKTYAEASNYIQMMSDQNPSSYISSTIGDASPGEIYAAEQAEGKAAAAEQTAAIVKEQAAEKAAAKQADGKAAAAEQAAAQSSKSSISSKNSHPEAETQKSVATNTGSTNVKATKSKVNPVASSGTLSVHTEVPKTSGAVRMTAAGAKTPAAAKNKTLSTLLPTTGDNALLSIILTFCGMVVLAGTGILLGLKQKYSGRHTK